jgi:hypothetical protein
MDNTIVAALIGALGSIIAAAVTATYGKGEAPARPQLQRRKLAVAIILIALIVGGSIAFVIYDGTYNRISQSLPEKDGYRKVIYARVGVGFLVPNHWRVDDASFRFASGDIDLIRDYDPNAASISQGMKLRFLNVQENYINNPEAEFGNMKRALLRIDSNVSDLDTKLAGRSGKKFLYTQSSGDRLSYIERTWVHLTPRVKLEISSFTNLDESTRTVFNAERDRILESFVIDNKRVSKLSAGQ